MNDPINAERARFTSDYVEADHGAALRVFHWQPEHPQSDIPLVFVAGWVSVVEGWADLLRVLIEKRPVYYIETREKGSARVDLAAPGGMDFGIEQMARDLVAVCNRLPIEIGKAVFSGSSLGSTAMLEAMKQSRLKPRGAFFIGPNSEFHMPWAAEIIMMLPAASYHLVKYPILWYLKNFRVDAQKEPEQWARYNATLRGAHPLRLKLSARGVKGYTVWSDLETIDAPVTLAYAVTDKLHGAENIERMVRALPKGKGLLCESNKYMHSAALAPAIEGFIAELTSRF